MLFSTLLQPGFSLHGPHVTGAMYPHFIREQRTKMELLRNPKCTGQPKLPNPHIPPPALTPPLNCQPSPSPKILAAPLVPWRIALLPMRPKHK